MEQLLARLKQKIADVEKTIEKTTGVRAIPVASGRDRDAQDNNSDRDSRNVKTFICSPFRNYPFRIKRRLTNPLVAKLAGQVVSYATLCYFVREYLIANKIPIVHGSIFRCDPLLAVLCGKDETSFFDIVRNFRSIVV
jgi:hypothetical protein